MYACRSTFTAHCSFSEETMSGNSSAMTSVSAQAVASSCGLALSASVSAHNRPSFSYVGKKYLQIETNQQNNYNRAMKNILLLRLVLDYLSGVLRQCNNFLMCLAPFFSLRVGCWTKNDTN